VTFSKLGADTETHQPVYLPKASRLQGLYIIGIQGTGKSGLIENLIMQDIDQQIGVCVLDPHGELIDHVLARLEPKHEKDVIYLDLADYKYPFGLNLFECPDPNDDGEIVKTLYQVLHVFEKAYGIVPTTPLMYDLLYHTVYTLIANPGYTMIDIRLLLTNEACRKKLAANVPNSDIQDFWRIWDDPKQTSQSKQQEDRKTILNKMNDFLHVPLRNIVGQSKTTFDLEDSMNTGKILLVKLSRRLEQPSNLIGSIIIAQLLNAAYARPTNKRKQFHLYADEFQNFATEDFATLLEEARKFGIGTTIAHQNRGQLNSANSQLETDLKDRSRSVGNMVVFKINSKDADELVGEFKITPQAAWEEEIEKESFERVEEEVIDGTEPILTIKQGDIIQHLDRVGHDNKRVMELFSKYITLLLSGGYRAYQYEPDDPLDTFLVAGMHGRFLHTSSDLQEKVFAIIENASFSQMGSLYLQKYSEFREGAAHHYVGKYPSDEDIRNAVKTFIARYRLNPNQQRGFFPTSAIKPLQEIFYCQLLQLFFIWSLSGSSCTRLPNNVNYIDFSRMQRTPLEQQWYQEKLEQEKKDEVEIKYMELPRYFTDEEFSQVYDQLKAKHWENARQQVFLCYRNGLHDTSFEMQQRQQYAWQLAQDMVARLQDFILGITELTYELSKPENQIKENSGLQQPHKRTQINYHTHPRKVIMHPQRTYQDVQNELATQLVSLPNFSARVKIGVNATQNPGKKCLSCKLLNRYGANYCQGCGKQLPAPHEYILTTLKPATGMNTQQLEQRIKRIQGRNLQQQGYLRDRKTVEAEITQRQTGCSSGSAPAQPQPQHPSPQIPRHARQVPVQGNCPKCGKSNPTGSKFCNQCGTKLI